MSDSTMPPDDLPRIHRLPDPARRQRRFRITLAIVAVLAICVYSLMNLWVETLWFGELGQKGVLYRRLTWSLVIGVAAGAIAFLLVLANLWIARRNARKDTYIPFLVPVVEGRPELPPQKTLPDALLRPLTVAAALVIATIIGFSMSSQWVTVLRFLGRSDFGVNDPHFGRDASFYVFSIPFFDLIVGFLEGMIVLSLIGSALVYFASGVIRYEPVPRIGKSAVTHFAVLIAGFFVMQAISARLQIWNLVSSERGVATGAGYTDLHARLPAYWVMMLASLLVAVLLVVFARRGKWRAAGTTVGAWLAIVIVGVGIVPMIVQGAVVSPNEIKLEQPVLKNNIRMTRYAYGLDNVKETEFAGDTNSAGLAKSIDTNQVTFDNIRLWNPETLRQALSVLQEQRSFYKFLDVDIDRYKIDGKYRQTLLSVREIDPLQVQAKKSWVNQRLQYTHGYGLAGAWVNEADSSGAPELFIQNIPPKYSTDLKVKQPAVYYGEQPDHYVITNTKQKEFDFPSGSKDATVRYQGKGGIQLSSPWRQFALAVKFRDPRMLLTSSITDESRFMFRRDVVERVTELAPFLHFDEDPYIAIIDGRQVWIIDGFTTTDRFPYSQHNAPAALVSDRINYIRNSVKATVDAYSGETRLYAVDEKDPILKTWRDIFPKLFLDKDKMSTELTAHLRYPEDLFELQSSIWSKYHMGDATVFYNNTDLWDIPRVDGIELEPFFILARLPGAEKEEMVLMRPMTPAKRQPMVAWMGARMDPGHYGELITYKLPKSEQTDGPETVAARINNDPVISQQFSLWSNQGTDVKKGNLLVIPVEESLMYVQPIFLESTSTKFPEFRKVIVAFGEEVAWGDTLPEALKELFKELGESTTPDTGGGETTPPTAGEPEPAGDVDELIAEASSHYDKALACQREGDWECYGVEIEAVGETLAQADN